MTRAESVDRESIVTSISGLLITDPTLKSLGKFKAMTWLPGDASNRYYGRIHLESQSLILMVMSAPEAFKSEEVTGAEGQAIHELPFVSIGRRFFEAGIRVPRIYFVARDSSFLVLEDLGDELLFVRRQTEPALIWYERAIDELAKIQRLSSATTPHRFTRELLLWETEHFVEYALLKRNKKISEAQLTELRKFLARLVDKMVSSDYVVCHRDFHSKNLLVLENESRVGVIDFQDALMGPSTYDLASLLRDSYIRLEDNEEERLIRHFETATKTKMDRELFGMTSLQRNLKAVGRFYYIQMVKGRDTHIPFVKPSLLRIFRTLKQMKELRVLSLLEGIMSDEAR